MIKWCIKAARQGCSFEGGSWRGNVSTNKGWGSDAKDKTDKDDADDNDEEGDGDNLHDEVSNEE